MFAISAVVAGTVSLEQLLYLEVYLVTYAVMALLLSLWILPAVVAALTPIPYRALMSRTRDALLMAFMTTSLFAVLPLLTEQVKSLLREFVPSDDTAADATDIIIPTSFNFPHAGKILSLSFVLFAGWFVDSTVPLQDYLRLGGSGILAMFGSVNAAIPFLLDQLRLPADTFRLFVASGTVNSRFGTLVAAVHTVAVAALGACALSGQIRIETSKIARFAAVTLLLTGIVVVGTRLGLQAALDRPYEMDTRLTSKRSFFTGQTASPTGRDNLLLPLEPDPASILERVRERKSLRIGYFDDSLPYVFSNRDGDLVGFDVDMARALAADLRVEPEFVRLDRSVLESGLDPDACDILMSGVALSADRALRLQYSSSYLDETVAFIVPDHRRRQFAEWSSVRAMGPLRIGAPRAPYYMRQLEAQLKDAQVVPFERVDAMFDSRNPVVDAIILTAERGSAYTLLHPDYSVVVPGPGSFKVPLAYVIAGRDAGMTSVVNIWIEQKRKDGTIEQLFAYWILGEDRRAPQRRWSVVDNLLSRAR
jgi:ABC-type amino acid transport substrate-binding protein